MSAEHFKSIEVELFNEHEGHPELFSEMAMVALKDEVELS